MVVYIHLVFGFHPWVHVDLQCTLGLGVRVNTMSKTFDLDAVTRDRQWYVYTMHDLYDFLSHAIVYSSGRHCMQHQIALLILSHLQLTSRSQSLSMHLSTFTTTHPMILNDIISGHGAFATFPEVDKFVAVEDKLAAEEAGVAFVDTGDHRMPAAEADVGETGTLLQAAAL